MIRVDQPSKELKPASKENLNIEVDSQENLENLKAAENQLSSLTVVTDPSEDKPIVTSNLKEGSLR
jgi:hypothetical protein